MKNAPDCPEHVGMPPEAKSPKSSTDAGITKQTKLAVLAALAALATTGCGTKLDDIERLDCEGGRNCVEFREIEALQRQWAPIIRAQKLTDPTDFTDFGLNPDGTMPYKDILTILNKRLAPNAPKTMKEWEEAGIEIERDEKGFVVTHNGELVMNGSFGCWDSGCSGEVRVFDDSLPTSRREIVELESNGRGGPMQKVSHTAFADGDSLTPTEIWYGEEKKENGGVKKSAGTTVYAPYQFAATRRSGCVETTAAEDSSWDHCDKE
ncbi:MAG: hypothetical protein AAB739_05265 [Patescibacteria group bacterium]